MVSGCFLQGEYDQMLLPFLSQTCNSGFLPPTDELTPIGGVRVGLIFPQIALVGGLKKRCVKTNKKKGNYMEALEGSLNLYTSATTVVTTLREFELLPPDSADADRLNMLRESIGVEVAASQASVLNAFGVVREAFEKAVEEALRHSNHDQVSIVAALDSAAEWNQKTLLAKCKSEPAKLLRAKWTEIKALKEVMGKMENLALKVAPALEIPAELSTAAAEDWKSVNQTVMSCLAVQVFSRRRSRQQRSSPRMTC